MTTSTQPETGAESMTEDEFKTVIAEFEAGVTKLHRRVVHAAAIVLLAILIIGTITTTAPVSG